MKNAFNRAHAQAMEACMVNVQYDQMKGNLEELQAPVSLYEWICAEGLSEMPGSFILWLAHVDLPHASIFFARTLAHVRFGSFTDEVQEKGFWRDLMNVEWEVFHKTLPDSFDTGDTAKI